MNSQKRKWKENIEMILQTNDHVLSFSSDCGCEIRIMETQEYFKAMLDILIYVNKEEKVRFHLSNEQGKGAYYSHLIMFKINNEWIYEEL